METVPSDMAVHNAKDDLGRNVLYYCKDAGFAWVKLAVSVLTEYSVLKP
jgi:hypothetical protein